MSKKKEKDVVRFILGTRLSPKSLVWRMWVTGNEIYLSASAMGKIFKFSLHSARALNGPEDWRIALTSEINKTPERVMLRWFRPPEIIPGYTMAVGVLVSPIPPAKPFVTRIITDERVIEYNPILKGENSRIVFRLLISDSHKMEADIAALEGVLKVLAHRQRKSGEKVWLIATELELTELERQKITKAMRAVKVYYKKYDMYDVEKDFGRILLLVADKEQTALQQPVLFDIALGQENVRQDRRLTRILEKAKYLLQRVLHPATDHLEL